MLQNISIFHYISNGLIHASMSFTFWALTLREIHELKKTLHKDHLLKFNEQGTPKLQWSQYPWELAGVEFAFWPT